jgi:hypothetical protein
VPLPFTDDSASGAAEQFAALDLPRHDNGLYSTGDGTGRFRAGRSVGRVLLSRTVSWGAAPILGWVPRFRLEVRCHRRPMAACVHRCDGQGYGAKFTTV